MEAKHKPPPTPGIWNPPAKLHGVSPGPWLGLRGSPRGGRGSLADVALHGALAPAAGDVAAPVVFAVAPLDHAVCVGVVTASAAHEVAAVTAMGRLVALPAMGAGGWGGEGRGQWVSICSQSGAPSLPPPRSCTLSPSWKVA